MSVISAQKATEIVFSCAESYGVESINMDEGLGRILAENVTADRDFPPFDRVTMDGICFHQRDYDSGNRVFTIIGTLAAGQTSEKTIGPGECIEIMTGASLPTGMGNEDLFVVRYEDVKIEEGRAEVMLEKLPIRNNVHRKGEDKIRGEILITKGVQISAAEINILATVGKHKVKVLKAPRIAIVSTGNELVDIEAIPLPYQIRRSNSYGIAALLSKYSAHIRHVHLPDDRAQIEQGLSSLIKDVNIIVLSGGVSKGKFDFIPEVLTSIGIHKHFHGVQQRPGKPFWFGSNDDCVVFALPGNPVSAIAGTCRYIVPFLRTGLGLEALRYETAKLKDEIRFTPKLTRYLEAHITSDETGQLVAYPVFGNGSGDFTRLLQANAFMELPADKDHFVKGDLVTFFRI